MKLSNVLFFLFCIVFIGCHSEVKKEDLKYLNGYWEIVKVKMPTGETKEFKINEMIDFIQFSDEKGFRNKVIPQLDGTFLTNKTKENFDVIQKEKTVYFLYKTNYASWEEELISINEKELVVKNSNDLQYFYKKRNDLNKN
jgi:hypothetical protein